MHLTPPLLSPPSRFPTPPPQSDQAGPRPTDSDNADGEGEGADNNAEGGEGGAGAESVYDPYGGANNNNGAPRVSRKSRLSIASTAHKGGARSASEDVDGDVDGDGAGDADSLDLSRTRDALKQLENDRLLGRVAKSRKLANKASEGGRGGVDLTTCMGLSGPEMVVVLAALVSRCRPDLAVVAVMVAMAVTHS